jgi:hypothetical protein
MAESKYDRLSWLDWVLIVALLLSLAGFAWYWFRAGSPQGMEQSLSEPWTNVLAIDLYASQDNSEKNVLLGQDMVLLAPTDEAGTVGVTNLLSYANVGNLQDIGLLAPVISSEITPQNPMFAQLRLLDYIEKGTKMTLAPLYQAGIRSLTLYRGRILLRLELNNIDTHQVMGYAIMSDGSWRLIYLVPMHNHHFSGQATPAND